jgi:hypothetical protein
VESTEQCQSHDGTHKKGHPDNQEAFISVAVQAKQGTSGFLQKVLLLCRQRFGKFDQENDWAQRPIWRRTAPEKRSAAAPC